MSNAILTKPISTINATVIIQQLAYNLCGELSDVYTAIIRDRSVIKALPDSFTSIDELGFAYEYQIERRDDYAIVYRSFV